MPGGRGGGILFLPHCVVCIVLHCVASLSRKKRQHTQAALTLLHVRVLLTIYKPHILVISSTNESDMTSHD
ncbi:uncharacterized protein BO95DRAFT_186787 [Aspergillus brunneoviolaceus CBS 621.78]|uniref:Uncharacterized protein n=1 Tax=Aspergillus brunneoviolaceus CBS 621.78 TaxID=1450534 RepID=A0ACD1G4I5_9EURO|nr:hypothetical protein BO95DRAFT_186787 [Aspergillus brunneoviolaceus CBS 621.78]RAH44154.1 hypothetical protein BO95DRAFT_186787 [Aspergillus brunneoviolaceus CBS 621.78]